MKRAGLRPPSKGVGRRSEAVVKGGRYVMTKGGSESVVQWARRSRGIEPMHKANRARRGGRYGRMDGAFYKADSAVPASSYNGVCDRRTELKIAKNTVVALAYKL